MLIKVNLATGDDLDFKVEGNVCIVGRSSKCQVVLPIEGISRQHCLIEIEGNKIWVTDLDSTNGITLNYQKIPPSTRVLYQAYFPLSFGPVKNMYIHPENYISQIVENPILKLTQVRKNAAPLAPLEVDKKSSTDSKKKGKEKSYSRSEMLEKEIKAKRRKQILINLLVFSVIISGFLIYMNMRNKPLPLKKEMTLEKLSTEFE